MKPITIVAIIVIAVAVWGIQRVWRRERRRKQAEYLELENYRGPEVSDSIENDVYNSDGRPN